MHRTVWSREQGGDSKNLILEHRDCISMESHNEKGSHVAWSSLWIKSSTFKRKGTLETEKNQNPNSMGVMLNVHDYFRAKMDRVHEY